MKKITLLLSCLFITSMLFAQQARHSSATRKARTAVRSAKNFSTHSQSAKGSSMRVAHTNSALSITPFYLEDFSGGTIPAGWSNVDAAGNGMEWVWTILGGSTGFDFLDTTGTTAANGYLKFDSDSSGTSIGGEDGILTTPAIDCSSHSYVHFTVNEFFAQYASSLGLISVSNDSVNWNTIHDAEAGLGQDQATANPNALDIDITAIAGGQATVYLRFEYIGDYDYYWFIDDVALYEPIAADGSVSAVTVDGFNSCSLSATAPVSALLRNNGSAAISNFPVSYTVNGGAPVTETFTGSINANDTATFTFLQTADLSAAGFYTIRVYTEVTGDSNNGNDTSETFALSFDHLDPSLSPFTMGFEPADDLNAWITEDVDGDGNTYFISNTYPHSGINSALKPVSLIADDNWLFSQCIDIGTGGNYILSYWYKEYSTGFPCNIEVYMGSTNTAAGMTEFIVASPLPGDTLYHQTIAPITVAPGTYYIGFHTFTTNIDGTDELYLDDINIDFLTGVRENTVAHSITIYPNPSDGKINISNTNGTEKEFTVTVYNAVGQVVFTKKYDNLVHEQVDLSEQPNGIYSVQLTSAMSSTNKSIVISNR